MDDADDDDAKRHTTTLGSISKLVSRIPIHFLRYDFRFALTSSMSQPANISRIRRRMWMSYRQTNDGVHELHETVYKHSAGRDRVELSWGEKRNARKINKSWTTMKTSSRKNERKKAPNKRTTPMTTANVKKRKHSRISRKKPSS